MITTCTSALIALLSGVTCKFYDDVVDIWKAEPGGFLLEGSQIALICFLTLFLIQDITITALFVVYTIICNLQGTADTVFWRAGGIVPLVAVCYHICNWQMDTSQMQQPQMQQPQILLSAAFIILTAVGLFAESATFPEEVSWRKLLGRAALIPIFSAIYYYTYDNHNLHFLPLIAAWTIGYNGVSIAFQLQQLTTE